MLIGDERRAVVDLLPQFLRGWSTGWSRLPPLVAAAGIAPPAYFLLRALVQERDASGDMTRPEMRRDLFNPYSTVHPFLDHLPALVAAGMVRAGDGRFIVAEAGHTLFARIEEARDAYLATLEPIPAAESARLAAALQTVADALWDAQEPADKAHHARPRRTPPPADAAPMVHLRHAIYCLWMARDDAHNTAWRGAGFAGPPFDLLSRVWSGEATTLPALTESVAQSQRPDDVRRGVNTLVEGGYLARSSDTLALTEHGRTIRDAIEAETDRVCFAPWPADTDAHWLRTTLATVIAQLGG